MPVHRHIKHWWPSVVTLAAVLWLTLAKDPAPDIEMPMLIPHLDKIVHAVMMGGLCGAVIFDYKRATRPPRPMTVRFGVWLVVAMAAFSGADELLQGAMHLGRAAEWGDFAADLAGITIAMLTAPAVCNRILPKG